MFETIFGGGTIFLGLLIAIGTVMKWPAKLNYVWAAVAIIWGILAFVL